MNLNQQMQIYHCSEILFKRIMKRVGGLIKDKCKEEMLRVIPRTDLTKLMKFKRVRNVDVVGFNGFLREMLSDKDRKRLIGIVQAGSYTDAMQELQLSYEQCRDFVSMMYDYIAHYVLGQEREYKAKEEIYLLLQNSKDKFSVLKEINSKYESLFEELLKQTAMRPITIDRMRKYLTFCSVEEAAAAGGCTVESVCMCTSRMFNMLNQILCEGVRVPAGSFISLLGLLNTRSVTVINSYGCKSVDDVRDMLRKDKVRGLGVACRNSI